MSGYVQKGSKLNIKSQNLLLNILKGHTLIFSVLLYGVEVGSGVLVKGEVEVFFSFNSTL